MSYKYYYELSIFFKLSFPLNYSFNDTYSKLFFCSFLEFFNFLVLGLVFLKYISDAFESKRLKLLKEDADNIDI
jgi:hypothetical protein